MSVRTTKMTFRLGLAAAVATAHALLAAPAAPALVSIESFETTTTTTQAGAHPDFSTSFVLEDPGEPEVARNVTFNAPEGLFGNPSVATSCTTADFALQQCSSDSQVGLVTVHANYSGDPGFLLGTAPIFSMVAGEEQTALFAFIVPTLHTPISVPVSVRTATDYGLRFTVSNITQLTPLSAADLTFWGFPAEEANDDRRFPKGSPGEPAGCPGLAGTGCIATPTKASIPEAPFTINPSVCTGQPLVTTLEVESYQQPGQASVDTSGYPATTGCDKPVFNPVLYAGPTTREVDSPSGLDIELVSPQFLTRATAPSQIRSVLVGLPEGLTINPDAADGQGSCPDTLVHFDTEGPAECPDGAKIGTFSLHTVALEHALTGSIYIGEPKPGNQYRLFLVASSVGIHAKLEAKVIPDPSTGQVSVSIVDLPQVPFDKIELHLFASDRGLMATPTQCRIYEVSAQFFPWNATLADQTTTQQFSLDSGPGGKPCPGTTRSFNPRLEAGTTNPVAGAYSDFALKLDRDDGDQFLGDVNFTLPPGFTGNLRGIAYCPEASIFAAARRLGREELAVPSCPSASQIGSTNVAAGPGGHPFHALGKMYLSGPLSGAPLSLVAITPALAGPYDYGVVVVRVALHIDPLTAQVRALSETMPQIVGGIPIRMRSIRVSIDRPNFTLNPTNCESMAVHSQGVGDQGTVADFFSPFTAVNCATLPFKPRMTVRQLGGRKNSGRARNPSLQFDLTTRPADANIKSLSVTLSSAFEIDQRHLGNICSEKELISSQCAGRTAIGEASTTSPLLDQPLSGPVYAVSGSGGLPRLAFILNGQVSLIPRADTVTVKGDRLRTVVPVVPDAPIGHFRLIVFGGKAGYLINTRDICARRPITQIAYVAQSGRQTKQGVRLKASCGKKKAHSKRHRR